MRTRRATKARSAVVIAAILAAALVASETAAFASPEAHVHGHYLIVSTDCYFSAGACSATFYVKQSAGRLWSPSDPLFHGRVRGNHVRFGETWPPGVSEDSWGTSGSTTDGGRTVTGTMWDGIGGSGTFVLTYVGLS